ncbi:MAG: hypothetical protein HYT72_00170 [Candidatus Aenigmarchaeota archaeon]|nr:hypothetical protein [Candidatus Aenigmarchaeota archaeon]
MPIIGFNLNSVHAAINEKNVTADKIDINSTPRIENIERAELNFGGIKEVLSVDFSFEIKYEPSVGEIKMGGTVLYQTENAKDVLAKWKKDKQVEGAVAMDVLNAVFRKCLTKALDLSLELRLPPPIQFPVVKQKEE